MAIKRKGVAWALLVIGSMSIVAGVALFAIPLALIVGGGILVSVGAFAVDFDDAE